MAARRSGNVWGCARPGDCEDNRAKSLSGQGEEVCVAESRQGTLNVTCEECRDVAPGCGRCRIARWKRRPGSVPPRPRFVVPNVVNGYCGPAPFPRQTDQVGRFMLTRRNFGLVLAGGCFLR